MIIRLLRRLRLLPRLPVSEREALEIARHECERRGWGWLEPIRVTEGLFGYTIWTNADKRGGNAALHVDGRTGRVTKATFAPR